MLGIFACVFHSRKVSSLEYYLWFLLLHICTFVVHFCIGRVEKIRDVEEMMKDFFYVNFLNFSYSGFFYYCLRNLLTLVIVSCRETKCP